MAKSPSSPQRATVTVLVIEDLIDTAETLARFLRVGCGYVVSVAGDGERGVRLAQSEHPDVVICDIGLPRLNGLEVARQLSQDPDYHPLMIAVTAYGGDYPESDARDAGFEHYLVKPADPFEIEAVIEGYVNRDA